MKVYYNGVTIQYASITAWDETVEYDESGMNLVSNKITLTVEGSVFPLSVAPEATNVTLNNYNAASSPADTTTFGFRLNYCLRQLSIPRQEFVMTNNFSEEVLFEAYPFFVNEGSGGIEAFVAQYTAQQRRNLDVNNGPKPRSVKVLQTCNEFARISFTIEISKIRCLAGERNLYRDGASEGSELQLGDDPSGLVDTENHCVVSNRFWTDETMDANFYTTRTISGKLRISTPLRSVHYWRDIFYPQLEEGFRRDSVRYSESQDGLSISYVIVDKQVRCAAPYPATTFSGSCSFSINNSSVMGAAFQLTMVGRPDAPKKALLQRCIDAFLNKTKQFNSNGASAVIQSFNVSENIGDPPSVSLNAKLMLTVTESTKLSASDMMTQVTLPGLNILGDPLEWGYLEVGGEEQAYERTKSETPNPYGYDVYYVYEKDAPPNSTNSLRGYIKCIATVPCVVHSPRYYQDSTIGDNFEEESKKTKVYRDKDGTEYGTSTQSSGAQQEAVSYPYTFYKSDISYYTDFSRIVLPKARSVAKSSANGSESDSETDYSSYSLAELKQSLQEEEESLETAEDEYDLYRMDAENSGMMTQEEIDAYMGSYQEVIDAIKKEIATIKREMDSRSSVRVVQVAQPVPKARVIIEAERFGRLPEMPDPEEIITTTGDDPITFTCLKAETQLCDPRAARNTNESVSYYVIGTYEYAMSRAYKKGDEVWLLQNPTFGANSYYPKISTKEGMIDDVAALTTMYDGRQLSHAVVEEESSDSGGEGNGSGGTGGSGSGEPEPDFNAD